MHDLNPQNALCISTCRISPNILRNVNMDNFSSPIWLGIAHRYWMMEYVTMTMLTQKSLNTMLF